MKKRLLYLTLILALLAISALVFAQDSKPVNVASETASSQSGASLIDTVKQGGWVMIPIMALALAALAIIIERVKFFLITKVWSRAKLQAHIDSILAQNQSLRYREEVEDELSSAVQIYINTMERGLGLLNGIGSLAPLLGFFGTVIGMIEAFAAIAAASTVNAKVVAVGIQVALVTTAGGLSVAVPALFAYHFFMHLSYKTAQEADAMISQKSASFPRLFQQADHTL